MTNHALVTGASTGIGRATVKLLVAKGWRVFAGVRQPADAESLRQEFGDKITPEIMDVTDPASIRAAAADIRAKLNGQTLNGLVNNAGVAGGGALALQPIEDIRRILDVNVLGVISVCQAMIPLLGADRSLTGGPGRIVNISSVAGGIAPPFLGAYAISKHGLEALTDSLRRELLIFGVDVIAVGPGAVATPIWDKAEKTDITPYLGSEYETPLRAFSKYAAASGREGLDPEAIASVILEALTATKPKARYAILRGKFLNWILPTWLPKRVLDGIIAKRLKLKPPA